MFATPLRKCSRTKRKRSHVLTWSIRTCLSLMKLMLACEETVQKHCLVRTTGTSIKICPQRFSRRKSLCPSYICTCCTLPSSQFSGNECSAGSALITMQWCPTQVQQMQTQGNTPRRGEPTGSRSPVKAWLPWRTASNWAATQELLGKVILSWSSWENMGLFADHLSEDARLLRRNTELTAVLGVYLFILFLISKWL